MKRLKYSLIIFQIIMVVVTYGHSFSRLSKAKWALHPDTEVMVTPVCAFFWPLYWSAIYWEEHQ